jgi:hypothetical protein
MGRRKSPLAGSGLHLVAHRWGSPCLCANLFFMMLVIFFIVIIVWAVGLITAYTLGGLIHLLLLLALIILLIEFLERRKVL